jgi:hypothetical protein
MEKMGAVEKIVYGLNAMKVSKPKPASFVVPHDFPISSRRDVGNVGRGFP